MHGVDVAIQCTQEVFGIVDRYQPVEAGMIQVE